MKIVIVGLGKMGSQLARKLHEDGHEVVVHDRAVELMGQLKAQGMETAATRQEAMASFGDERVVVWLMIPAEVVDVELDAWLEILPQGSIVIDGGNSDYRHTKTRAQRCAVKNVVLIDIGTSGGVWGYRNGFSLMVGGDAGSVQTIEPIMASLCKPEGAFQYFGDSGSGHFVKMVHNAVEYGMMESLAEGFRLMKEGPYPDLDVAAAADVWQHRSVVTSWLNELSRDVLRANPQLDGVDGFVAESGEARWALETAREKNIPMPSIQAAFDVRLASQKGDVNFTTRMLAAMRNAFGGHATKKS